MNFRASKQRRQNSSSSSTSDRKSSQKKIDDEGNLVKNNEYTVEQTVDAAASGGENARQVLEEFDEAEFEHDLKELEAEINLGTEEDEVGKVENAAQKDEAKSGGEQRMDCPTTLSD